MANHIELEYALMAGRAYQATRDKDNNWFPIPDGWTEFLHVPNDTYPTTSGFEAVSFQSTTTPNQIVISYAGTYPKDVTGDIAADIALGGGSMSAQLKQAMDYYLKVRAANAGAASARILATSADGNTAYNVTTFIRDKDNPNLWKNPDGQMTLAHGDTWQLQTGGGSIDLGSTFTDGDYGIHRKGPDTVITPTNTITGTGDGNNLSGTGASDLIDGQGGNDILSGADGNDKLLGGARRASPAHYFRHIYMAWPDGYSAGIHQTRDHAGDSSPERDLDSGIQLPEVTFALESCVMKKIVISGRQTKVSRGGAPNNEPWKLAA